MSNLQAKIKAVKRYYVDLMNDKKIKPTEDKTKAEVCYSLVAEKFFLEVTTVQKYLYDKNYPKRKQNVNYVR